MRGGRQGFPRRWRSEWAPMAWDLGEPVEIRQHLPWFSPPPEPGFLPSPEQTTTSRFNDYVRRHEELDVAWKEKYLIGWPHGPRHAGYDGSEQIGELLLYPQGFVQEMSTDNYVNEHPSCLSFYKVTDDLVPHLRSLWSGDNEFLHRVTPHRGPRFVTHQRLSEAWRLAGESTPSPQPTSTGLGWLVFGDGRLTEILGEHVTPGHDENGTREPEGFVELQLPTSMRSFLFELHTKGMRRYHKQAILGACLMFVAFGLIVLMPENAVSLVGVLVGVAIYHFFSGRAGVRTGELARSQP